MTTTSPSKETRITSDRRRITFSLLYKGQFITGCTWSSYEAAEAARDLLDKGYGIVKNGRIIWTGVK